MSRGLLQRLLLLCALLATLTNYVVTCTSNAASDLGGFNLRHNMVEDGTSPPSWLASVVHRALSITKDLFTGEAVKTVDGDVPRTSCPIGYFRPPGGTDLVSLIGQRLDGCVKCPRGKYGSAPGQTDNMCSGSCPTGKYSDVTGITDIFQCKMCPTGRYGATPGLKTAQCSAACPTGKWSEQGATGSNYCIDCEFNLSGHKRGCTQNMDPREPLH